jgi:hypothetical protein
VCGVLLCFQRARTALNVPFGWFSLAIGICAWCATRSASEALGPALIALVLVSLGVSRLRLLAVSDECLFVRAPFRAQALDARACAFGIERKEAFRGGPTYVVFLTDGARHVPMAWCLSLTGAESCVRRLESVLLQDTEPAASAGARAHVAGARASWEAILAARAAYQSTPAAGRWQRIVAIWLVFVAVVVLVCAAASLLMRGCS